MIEVLVEHSLFIPLPGSSWNGMTWNSDTPKTEEIVIYFANLSESEDGMNEVLVDHSASLSDIVDI